MLSAIIATRESERSLVPTLAALVPAVTAGFLSDVIVADAGSRDATREVAEIAGCEFLVSSDPLGQRLKSAGKAAKGSWLLFLRAGTVPDSGWVAAAERFIAEAEHRANDRAACFRPPPAQDLLRPTRAELIALLRAAFGGMPRPQQGLLIARRFYDALGGHPEGDAAETALIRRLGRRRIAMLPASARYLT